MCELCLSVHQRACARVCALWDGMRLNGDGMGRDKTEWDATREIVVSRQSVVLPLELKIMVASLRVERNLVFIFLLPSSVSILERKARDD